MVKRVKRNQIARNKRKRRRRNHRFRRKYRRLLSKCPNMKLRKRRRNLS
jgi:hypothetical protein